VATRVANGKQTWFVFVLCFCSKLSSFSLRISLKLTEVYTNNLKMHTDFYLEPVTHKSYQSNMYGTMLYMCLLGERWIRLF
jgi:hypothetical protein